MNQILLISGNNDLIKALQIILKDKYEIVAERVWHESQEYQNKADSIIVDLSSFDGVSLKELRKIVAKTERPVIVIIDDNDVKNRKEAIKTEIYDYIELPLDPDRVLMTIVRAVNCRSLRKLRNEDRN